MPTCVPIKDMKDTARFARLVEESPDPITVTRNGYDAFVVMRSADYDALQRELEDAAKRKLLERIELAEQEKAQGSFEDYEVATRKLKEKYDL